MFVYINILSVSLFVTSFHVLINFLMTLFFTRSLLRLYNDFSLSGISQLLKKYIIIMNIFIFVNNKLISFIINNNLLKQFNIIIRLN